MKVKQATIETPNYSLPIDPTRLLARLLWESGWIDPAHHHKLAFLWLDGAADADDIQTAVNDVFVPSWQAANMKFQIDVERLEAELQRKITDDERMQMHFPHGNFYVAAQDILSRWFESQMRDVSALLN